ncbi:MAG: tRNA (adenosine(37)-N6)-dimethylallyltransferase MiaA [Christensenellales bacterium]
MQKQKIVLIGGPTAVGKSALAIKVANLFDGEILSCDSIAIYKGLNIGSAKPTKEEQQLAKHHLIDIKEPYQEYSVAEYKQDADNIISNLKQQNKLPIVCGGTGLYMKVLLFGLERDLGEKSTEIRQKYKDLAKEYGNKYVLDILAKIDPATANKLSEQDLVRIIRAIEIYELTGKKKSAFVQNNTSEYDYMLIFLNDDRQKLYERIDKRVDKMFEMGLLDEVENLVKTYNLTRDSQSMGGIGYKEFFDYFEHKIDLQQLKENIKLNSRHYAKRQITWFKGMQNVKEYDCNNVDLIIKDIKKFLNE